jgi:hypothetical protein
MDLSMELKGIKNRLLGQRRMPLRLNELAFSRYDISESSQ